MRRKTFSEDTPAARADVAAGLQTRLRGGVARQRRLCFQSGDHSPAYVSSSASVYLDDPSQA